MVLTINTKKKKKKMIQMFRLQIYHFFCGSFYDDSNLKDIFNCNYLCFMSD